MTELFDSAEELHYKFCGDPIYIERSSEHRVWKAVELLSLFVDKTAYVAAERTGDGQLHLRALTTTHLYSVTTDEPPAVVVQALHLSRLLVRGDPSTKAAPTLEVALHLRDSEADPIVFTPKATYSDHRQLDELLALLPALRDAVV